jgi:protease IV
MARERLTLADNRIKRFAGAVWRVLDGLRRVLHLGLMLLLLLLVLAILAVQPTPVPDVAVLVVKPEGELVEQLAGDAFDRALAESRGDTRAQTLVKHVVDAIDQAAGDERIRALYLELDQLRGGSLDKLEAIGEALHRFSAAGKPIIAAAGAYDQTQYYLASLADELYIHPLGGVLLEGFGYFRPYFKSALEKLSVDWYVFRSGEHKTYGDSFIRNNMSDAEKEDLRPVLDGLWGRYRRDVAGARELQESAVDRYVEQFLARLKAADGDLAEVALEAGLVDGLWTFDQVENRLAELATRDPVTGSFAGVEFRDYLAARDAVESVGAGPTIGVIVASGNILPGDRPPGSVGDETFAEMLREVRQDPGIRALVLRVDSGGGSQFASEIIMREVELVRQAGKPVLVSMGGVAASGGYVIALPADEIWAHPSTVTGSIGVIASLPNFDRALERVGVNVDGIGTHRYSGDFRLDRPLSAEARQVMELAVEGAYDRFVGQVARARGLDVAAVRRVAGGRIWLGETAQRIGLVDRLGTLQETIEAAASRAGLGERYEVRVIEQTLDFSEMLMVRLFATLIRAGFDPVPIDWLASLPAPVQGLAAELERMVGFSDPLGLYYHCLCGRP